MHPEAFARSARAAALMTPLLLATRPARADDTVVGVGPLASLSVYSNNPVAFGLGGELSATWLEKDSNWGLPNGYWAGGFAQAQAIAFDRSRFALGAHAGWVVFGFEAGVYREGAGGGRRATYGLHLASLFTVGVAYVGLRFGVPIVSEESEQRRPRGFEGGLTLAFKLPILLGARLVSRHSAAPS